MYFSFMDVLFCQVRICRVWISDIRISGVWICRRLRAECELFRGHFQELFSLKLRRFEIRAIGPSVPGIYENEILAAHISLGHIAEVDVVSGVSVFAESVVIAVRRVHPVIVGREDAWNEVHSSFRKSRFPVVHIDVEEAEISVEYVVASCLPVAQCQGVERIDLMVGIVYGSDPAGSHFAYNIWLDTVKTGEIRPELSHDFVEVDAQQGAAAEIGGSDEHYRTAVDGVVRVRKHHVRKHVHEISDEQLVFLLAFKRIVIGDVQVPGVVSDDIFHISAGGCPGRGEHVHCRLVGVGAVVGEYEKVETGLVRPGDMLFHHVFSRGVVSEHRLFRRFRGVYGGGVIVIVGSGQGIRRQGSLRYVVDVLVLVRSPVLVLVARCECEDDGHKSEYDMFHVHDGMSVY